MTLLEGARDEPRGEPPRSSGTADRVEALLAAVGHARGRVDPAVLQVAEATAERAAGRMRLSADHTIVAIAGATGSGKSSTFNALTGLDLSAVGVRRPTTSWATACVWGSHDADAVLDWLGIPPRHQTTRDSMLDRDRDGRDLDGVVLLDLPDHDSTEVSHHLEVDRLVTKADLMVWILDPQKYADAAVHERYLAPMAEHADSIVVVLNHIDGVPEPRREAMLDDVRRLLSLDGLATVPVIGVSAREGWGIDALRAEIAKRVVEKGAARTRVEVDVRESADRLGEAAGVGTAHPALHDDRVAAFESALAEAAGVPVVVDAVESQVRRRTRRATGWPLTAWAGPSGGRGSVARTGLDLDGDMDLAQALDGRDASEVAAAVVVQRDRSDAEVRSLAEDAADGLPPAWQRAVRRVSTERSEQLAARLDATLSDADVAVTSLPGWARAVQAVQWLLLLVALAAAGWGGAVLAGATDSPSVGPVPLGLVVALAALVAGPVLALVCRPAARRTASMRREVADEMLRRRIGETAREVVLDPLHGELAAHRDLAAALARARA